MYQLNYHSISKPDLNLKDLDAILENAIANNAARNISGCLIYHNERFVQILEGRKKDVLYVYEKITADDRHHTITLLWENKVESRFFADWNMAFYRPGDEDIIQFVNNLTLLSEFSKRTTGSILSFWISVRKILRGGTINNFYED